MPFHMEFCSSIANPCVSSIQLDPKMGTTQISRAGNSGYLISQLSKMDTLFSKLVSALANTTCLDIVLFLDLDERQMREGQCYFVIHYYLLSTNLTIVLQHINIVSFTHNLNNMFGSDVSYIVYLRFEHGDLEQFSLEINIDPAALSCQQVLRMLNFSFHCGIFQQSFFGSNTTATRTLVQAFAQLHVLLFLALTNIFIRPLSPCRIKP